MVLLDASSLCCSLMSPAYGAPWFLQLMVLLDASSLWCSLMPPAYGAPWCFQLMVLLDASSLWCSVMPPAYGAPWYLQLMVLLDASSVWCSLMPQVQSNSFIFQLIVLLDASSLWCSLMPQVYNLDLNWAIYHIHWEAPTRCNFNDHIGKRYLWGRPSYLFSREEVVEKTRLAILLLKTSLYTGCQGNQTFLAKISC